MGNQYYLIVENPLEQNDEINFGFRVDNLFGNDWQFNHMHGLFDNVVPAQPLRRLRPRPVLRRGPPAVLTKGGIDIKGGRFYTILGYEVVPATGRPLLSVPYMFNYGQPFTHFGVLSTLARHRPDQPLQRRGQRLGPLDQRRTTSGTTSAASPGPRRTARRTSPSSYICGPEPVPQVPAGEHADSFPPATPRPVRSPAGRNPGYGGNDRTLFTTVFTYKWTDKLTQVMETDQAYREERPRHRPGRDVPQNAEWYSFGNWFL